MSTLNPLVLRKFKKSHDKDSANFLNSITGGVPLHKFPTEVNKILDYITEYTSLSAESDPLREECELTHEDFLADEPNPSFSISSYSALEPSPELGTSEEGEIRPPKFHSRFEDDPSRTHKYTSNLINAQVGEEHSPVHADQSQNSLTEPSLRPTVPPSPPDPHNEAPLEEALKEEWSNREKCFSKAIWISSPFMITPCSIRGITVEAQINPIMEVNILAWHLAYTLLGNVTLRLSDKLLQSCPLGYILECQGGARDVPLVIDKIEVNLDFHIFDILDFDLLLCFLLEKLHASQESLDEKLRKTTSATVSCLENSMVKHFPEPNLLKEMMHESPFISSDPILFEIARFATSEENDPEEILYFCEDERSSSLSSEFEPFPASPKKVVLDHDRDSTMISHDESLQIENPWATECYAALTMESIEKDSIYEHVSFILVIPQKPCSFNTSPELGTHCAQSTHTRTTTALRSSLAKPLEG
jgi:hypothetical protein